MEHIINKIQNGDEMAFKQLSQSIENDLYRVSKTRLSDEDDIRDAIQNTMIITYKNAKKIKNIECFKSWMMRVLINECNKIYNKNKKNNEIFNKIVVETGFEHYDNSIQNVQDKMSFEALIERLSYEERIVITLHYNSQFSCSQISKILKTNVNTIKSRLKRGVNKIKKYYKEENFYDSRR